MNLLLFSTQCSVCFGFQLTLMSSAEDMCEDCRLFSSHAASTPGISAAAVHASHSTSSLDNLRQSTQLRMSTNDSLRYAREYSTISTSGRRRESSMIDSGIGSSLSRDQQLMRGYSRYGQRQQQQQQNTSAQNNNMDSLPTAVNVKTGTSVFTLDFPAARTTASYERPPTAKLPPKLRTRRSSQLRPLQGSSSKEEKSLLSGRRLRSRTSLAATKSEEDLHKNGGGSSGITSSVSSNTPSVSITSETTTASNATSQTSSMSDRTTVAVTNRSERPSFLLDSDDEMSNVTDDEFVSKVNSTIIIFSANFNTVCVQNWVRIGFFVSYLGK